MSEASGSQPRDLEENLQGIGEGMGLTEVASKFIKALEDGEVEPAVVLEFGEFISDYPNYSLPRYDDQEPGRKELTPRGICFQHVDTLVGLDEEARKRSYMIRSGAKFVYDRIQRGDPVDRKTVEGIVSRVFPHEDAEAMSEAILQSQETYATGRQLQEYIEQKYFVPPEEFVT